LKARILTALFLICSALPHLGAQAPATFTVSGTIHDVTGSLIPGADVSIASPGAVSPGSGPLTAVTDTQGSFQVTVPAAGSYIVSVKAPGFADFQAQTRVTADSPSPTLDIQLAISATAETVEVTANALAAETTSTQIGETLETKKIESAPLNGRNFTDLIAVQPGIVPVNTAQPGAVIMTGVATTPPSGNANPGNLSISGQREASNGFRVTLKKT